MFLQLLQERPVNEKTDSNALFGIKGTIGTSGLSNYALKNKYYLKITLFYLYSACILFC